MLGGQTACAESHGADVPWSMFRLLSLVGMTTEQGGRSGDGPFLRVRGISPRVCPWHPLGNVLETKMEGQTGTGL